MGDRILILGATGMLGHTLLARLAASGHEVYATARSMSGLEQFFAPELMSNIIGNVDVDNFDTVIRAIAETKPDVVINCIGIIKQLPSAQDPITTINTNALLPHRIAKLCQAAGARMIHISTDCVFDGVKGNYTEADESNATDLYGRTKFLGEVAYPHTITLRTSIIGHELKSSFGLIDWFLAQSGKIRGFTKAIYTGFPTVEIAAIIDRYVLPKPELHGLWQVSSDPINKYELLKIVGNVYAKNIEIEPDADFCLDRSLDSSRFREATGYHPPSWPQLVAAMHQEFLSFNYKQK
ncbi:MAG: SDR family oxidoreductase [Peptococcaceae bacterium]|nr:SDR family oxidoreductase [Peptococcaceae bacterium]